MFRRPRRLRSDGLNFRVFFAPPVSDTTSSPLPTQIMGYLGYDWCCLARHMVCDLLTCALQLSLALLHPGAVYALPAAMDVTF